MYLEEAFKDGPELFLLALSHVVSAHGGVGKLAKKTGLSRESLYKLLSGDRGLKRFSQTFPHRLRAAATILKFKFINSHENRTFLSEIKLS